ncbi:MAG: hypothetical protein IPN60_03640 [Saprospiraceae bacterium]|nr:hypothetical protein [Candidatus Opimibacter skivensis]
MYIQQNSINYRDYSPQFPSDVENGEALPYKSYYDYELNQFFIGIPLEAKIKLGKAEKTNHFFISGGARFQYLFNTTGTEQLVESGQPWQEEDIDQEEFDSNSMWTLLTMLAKVTGYKSVFVMPYRTCEFTRLRPFFGIRFILLMVG